MHITSQSYICTYNINYTSTFMYIYYHHRTYSELQSYITYTAHTTHASIVFQTSHCPFSIPTIHAYIRIYIYILYVYIILYACMRVVKELNAVTTPIQLNSILKKNNLTLLATFHVITHRFLPGRYKCTIHRYIHTSIQSI